MRSTWVLTRGTGMRVLHAVLEGRDHTRSEPCVVSQLTNLVGEQWDGITMKVANERWNDDHGAWWALGLEGSSTGDEFLRADLTRIVNGLRGIAEECAVAFIVGVDGDERVAFGLSPATGKVPAMRHPEQSTESVVDFLLL